MAKTSSKKRKVVVESYGEAHITASFNNIIISLTNNKGEVISWSSAGKMGFRGSKKSTPFAAQSASVEAAKKAMEHGLSSVEVRVKGPGAGRENAIRALVAAGLKITSVADRSPIPHNGCRPPKRRRV